MLGLVFLLLFVSHVAVPCVMTSGHGFAARGGMCQEDKVAQADSDSNQYFLAPMPRAPEITIATTLLWLATVAVLVSFLTRPSRFPLAVSARGRPFLSSDTSFLSYFAAKRDA